MFAGFQVFKKKNKIRRLLLIGFILVNLIPSFIIQELLTNGLLYNAITLFFLVVVLPFTFITLFYFLWQGNPIIKVFLWFVLCLGTFGLMMVPFFHPVLFNKNMLTAGLWFLIIFVLLNSTLLIFNFKGSLCISFFKFLVVTIILCLPTIFARILPCVYTPPALTEKNIQTYNTALSFLHEREYLKTFRINMRDWIPGDVRENMSEDDIQLAMQIRNKLIKIGCYQFEKKEDLILFYKHGNRIFPSGCGLVYSINGDNPNNIENEQINKLKPFAYLTGNWYMSHNMTFIGPRIDILTNIPKALIDRSNVIKGIPEQELHRFDNWQKQIDSNSEGLCNEKHINE